MVPPSHQYVVCLHGEFDGYGDFFTIGIRDIEYVDLPGRITVGDVFLVERLAELGAVSEKWPRLAEEYSGKALVCRSADAEGLGSHTSTFIVVANDFEIHCGRDWPESWGELGES